MVPEPVPVVETPEVQAPPPPKPVSATWDAATKGDQAAFDKAHLAARTGKPLPEVAATPEVPQPTAKERRQQAENDRIRAAVDEGIKQRLAEERTKWEAERPARPAEAPRPIEPPAPREWKTVEDAIRHPDLSKPLVSEGEFFTKFPEAAYSAYARYAASYDYAQREVSTRQQSETETIRQAQKEHIASFLGQIEAAKAADPTFVDKLTDRVKRDLKPFSALQPGEFASPINVIGEQVYDSPLGAKMLLHFSEHPEDLDRLLALPAHLAHLPGRVKIERHTAWMIREFGKLEGRLTEPEAPAAPEPTKPTPSPVSAAPPPPPTVSRARSTVDPKASALKNGDVGAFLRLDLQERAAKRKGA